MSAGRSCAGPVLEVDPPVAMAVVGSMVGGRGGFARPDTEQHVEGHLRVAGLDDADRWQAVVDEAADGVDLGPLGEVDLVEQDDIGVPRIWPNTRSRVVGSSAWAGSCSASMTATMPSRRTGDRKTSGGECPGDVGPAPGHPAGFEHERVKLAILAQRTLFTAATRSPRISQHTHPLARLNGARLDANDQLQVDGDRAEVVDDHRDAQSVGLGQDPVDQRGLSRAEKPGQHGDGRRSRHVGRLRRCQQPVEILNQVGDCGSNGTSLLPTP